MVDVYASFNELAAQEIEGEHYQIHVIDRGSPILILAPHGGYIEPGTLQIGKALADDCYSFYGFESLEKHLNCRAFQFEYPRNPEKIPLREKNVSAKLIQQNKFLLERMTENFLDIRIGTPGNSNVFLKPLIKYLS